MARKQYSLEFRQQVVDLVQAGRPIASVAKEFGLADQTVGIGCKQLRTDR